MTRQEFTSQSVAAVHVVGSDVQDGIPNSKRDIHQGLE